MNNLLQHSKVCHIMHADNFHYFAKPNPRITGIIVILSSPSFGMIPDKAGINLPFRSIVTSICAFAVECEIGSKMDLHLPFSPQSLRMRHMFFQAFVSSPKRFPLSNSLIPQKFFSSNVFISISATTFLI